ncbi:unnamed protein product [Scytosiphon promiscuus]
MCEHGTYPKPVPRLNPVILSPERNTNHSATQPLSQRKGTMGWFGFGQASATRKAKALSRDLRGKHVVVTGANTGLGYATARELAKMGGKVTLACRSAERGQEALERLRREALEKPVAEGVDLLEGLEDVDVQLEILDLASLQSVVSFARRLRTAGTKVDVLINNAGIFGVPERRETVDGFEMQIGVNHFAVHLLTRLMEPLLFAAATDSDGGGGGGGGDDEIAGARVVFLSSLAHDRPPGLRKTTWDWTNINFDRPRSYNRVSAYGRSKLANVLDAKEFAARLALRRVSTYAVQPGLVKTEIHRSMADGKVMALVAGWGYAALGWVSLRTPLEGALTTLMCAVDPALAAPALSGKYWGNMKEEEPSELASDPANPPRLWEATESLLEEKLGHKVDDLLELPP